MPKCPTRNHVLSLHGTSNYFGHVDRTCAVHAYKMSDHVLPQTDTLDGQLKSVIFVSAVLVILVILMFRYC